MKMFLISFVVLLLAIAGMAVGVIFGRRPIQGSCGGLRNIEGLEQVCDCESPCEKRRAQLNRRASNRA